MRCPRCHATYSAGIEFCPTDGTKLIAAASGTADRLLGTVLDGRYRLVERIGSGGMGAVYRATQLNIEREVAIKLLHADLSSDDRLCARFENEARIIAKLKHPSILRLIDFGVTCEGKRFIVVELLAGQSLAAHLHGGPLDGGTALWIIGEIADALTEAHSFGIVHRDLKPENIFLERAAHRDVVKVLDFGIALFAEASFQTTTGAHYGSPAYMSPEQARGLAIDGRSDLYSLGVIAYQCLTGRRPFMATTPAALLLKHISEAPPSLAAHIPDSTLDPDIEAFVMSLLEKRPEDRPQTAAEVRAVVDRLLGLRREPVSALSLSPRSRASKAASSSLVVSPAWIESTRLDPPAEPTQVSPPSFDVEGPERADSSSPVPVNGVDTFLGWSPARRLPRLFALAFVTAILAVIGFGWFRGPPPAAPLVDVEPPALGSAPAPSAVAQIVPVIRTASVTTKAPRRIKAATGKSKPARIPAAPEPRPVAPPAGFVPVLSESVSESEP